MKKIFTLAFLIISLTRAHSQYFAYSAANASIVTTNTYTDLGTAGTAITTNYLGQPIGKDDNSNVQNIGFTFSYSGTDYTQFTLNTNGFIKLGNDTVKRSVCRDVLASTDPSATNVIYALNVNLQSTPNTEYRVFTQGVAGSKTCTIQYKAVADSGCLNCGPSDPQYDYMEFQIVMHEGTNIVEFIIGNWTASASLSNFVQTNCGLKLNSPARSVNVTKSSQTAFTSASFIDGNYTGNHFNIRNSLPPTIGLTYKFIPVIILQNNTSLLSLRYNGKVAKGYNNYASAVVQNIGKTTYTNYTVNLTTTGANTGVANQVIPSFAPGQIDTVFFPVFNWANTGNTYSKVSLPNDDDNTDNTDTIKQSVTTNTLGTAFDTSTRFRVGSNSSQIEMAARFSLTASNKIVSVSPYIATAGQQFRVYIYSVDADTPKSKMYSGTTITSVQGKNTVTLATPLAVTGDFFVDVVQISATTNLGLGYNYEPYIRSKLFYFRSPQGSSIPATSSWFDAKNSTLPFTKFMIDATFQNAPVPVKFSYFNGVKEGNKNALSWQTANEIDNMGFEIQRSFNGIEFAKIGFVNGRGNSNSIVNYSFDDINPLAGNNYYRLRQIDKNGKESFSEIVLIKDKQFKQLELVRLFPNPSSDNSFIIFNTGKTDKLNITIVSTSGKVVHSQVITPAIGENKVQLNTTGLPTGNYIINIAEMNTENFISTKFIKQ